ncbi:MULTISPECIES: SDR family NAD(P)-dependent oxidoreductase [unclassified Nostoc]|uniref:SDR family NAD(P)-dependent oxidoreductase n=1 Tax=unclassified Nostoc TaxID=2593658 RepID=UPI001D13DF1B|nr:MULTISPECIES: SDR family NAD(P)-dependent oxidoreductase [unclassified Nostoc]
MNHILKNKRALITGGSRGIGAAIVKRLASVGADVAFTYTSSPDRANEIVQAAQALGVQALAIQADSAVQNRNMNESDRYEMSKMFIRSYLQEWAAAW